MSAPGLDLLTYRVPPRLLSRLSRGMRVLVPLGRRRVTGYLVEEPRAELAPEEEGLELKDIFEPLDEEPLLDEGLLRLARWAADYYCAGLGEVLKTALPGLPERKSVARLLLTARGEEAARRDDLPGLRGRILRFLREEEKGGGGRPRGLPLGRLAAALGKGVYAASVALEREGLAERAESYRGGADRPGQALWAELAGEGGGASPPGRRAPLQASLLDRLAREGGRLPVARLASGGRGSRAALQQLARKGLVRIRREEAPPLPPRDLGEGSFREEGRGSVQLLPAQSRALASISADLRSGRFAVHLLHGVTGSGKTEVYLRAIEEALSLGRGALVLVPEIALTPQLLGRFQGRFGEGAVRLHSALPRRERWEGWMRLRAGGARVALGTRSAVFAPLARLGLIVVDEEHDPSYKQEDSPRYHARDLAIVRAREAGAVCVLGSATPSVESYENARRGKYRLSLLPARPGERPLPSVRLVDLRVGEPTPGGGRLPGGRRDAPLVLSRALEEAIRERLGRGEQVILFLNRRGYASFVLCRDCGQAARCPRCSVSLTYHLSERLLRCHYCEYVSRLPGGCERCGGSRLIYFGLGTQRVEEALRARFPQARVGRLDRDAVRPARGGPGEVLGRVRRGELDILVGTQMVAKGHHFPRVTLAGVIAADLSLNLPDFRAAERTFQLLTQVAGRSGRGETPGEVIIQAFHCGHYAVQCAREHDYASFFAQELEARRALGYPPFRRLARLTFEGRDEGSAKEAAGRAAREAGGGGFPGVEALGPAEAMVKRVKDVFRYQVLLKGERPGALRDAARAAAEAARGTKGGVRVAVDIDPVGPF